MDFHPRRSASRLRAELEAQLVTLSGTQPATLHDLSTGGAKLGASRLPRSGECVVLKWDGVEAFGTVMWSRDGQCGVWFDELLDQAVVLAARVAVDTSGERNRDKLRSFAREWVTGSLNRI